MESFETIVVVAIALDLAVHAYMWRDRRKHHHMNWFEWLLVGVLVLDLLAHLFLLGDSHG